MCSCAPGASGKQNKQLRAEINSSLSTQTQNERLLPSLVPQPTFKVRWGPCLFGATQQDTHIFPEIHNDKRDKRDKWQNKTAKQHFKCLTLKLINIKENTELHNNWGNVIKTFLKYTSCRLMEKFGQGKDFSDRRKQIQMVLRS